MRKWVITGIVLALCLALAAGASAAQVEAVGAGHVRVMPDSATLSLGVSENGMDVQAAQRSVNERIDAVRKALTAEGVAREDIAVESINVYTNYDYSDGLGNVTGYNVSHQLTITVRDLDKLGALIDAALNAGVNQLYGVSFELEDNAQAYEQALALAIEAASAHARAMAKAAGLTLGELAELTETPNYYTYSPARGKAMEDSATGTSVDVGDLVVSASVTAIYNAQ